MLPQRTAVAFVLAEVAVNGAVMECDPVETFAKYPSSPVPPTAETQTQVFVYFRP